MPAQLPKDAGLSQRMQRETARISSQHRQLDDFHAVVRDALERGDAHGATNAFARFADALEAHLSLEDEFYFPALHGLARDLAAELAALSEEHAALRTGMRAVADCLASESPTACASALAGWIAELSAHERREESLLARVQARPRDGGA
jgi:iron-sulfur cluster repair protein YtfE (RIC family)